MANQKKEKYPKEPIRTQKQANCLKCGKTRATKSWLALVLYLIGRESGASFLNQSQSEVKQNRCNPRLFSTLNWNWRKGQDCVVLDWFFFLSLTQSRAMLNKKSCNQSLDEHATWDWEYFLHHLNECPLLTRPPNHHQVPLFSHGFHLTDAIWQNKETNYEFANNNAEIISVACQCKRSSTGN